MRGDPGGRWAKACNVLGRLHTGITGSTPAVLLFWLASGDKIFPWSGPKFKESYRLIPLQQSRDKLSGIALGYELDDRGSSPGRAGNFSHYHRLWGPPSLLSNGC
jgi:hypothetical protein